MMRRHLLLPYQLLSGLSDTTTGLCLIAAPQLTLHLMKLHAIPDTLPFLSFIGVFVLSVGIACLYGASVADRPGRVGTLETIWLLTSITRGLVAAFVAFEIFSGALEPGWATVAVSDGALAILQAIGLGKGWLHNAWA